MIFYEKHFQKAFDKLPEKIKMQFGVRLGIFLKNRFDPILVNHSVDPQYPDCRSINVTGDYRAIFREEKDLTVFVVIGTHSELY